MLSVMNRMCIYIWYINNISKEKQHVVVYSISDDGIMEIAVISISNITVTLLQSMRKGALFGIGGEHG